MGAGRHLNCTLANEFPKHSLGLSRDVRNPWSLPIAAASSSPPAHRLGQSSSAPVSHSATLLLVVNCVGMIDASSGMNAPFRLVYWATTPSTTQIGRHMRSASEVMWERYFRLDIWWFLMTTGGREGSAGRVLGRRRDRMCPPTKIMK